MNDSHEDDPTILDSDPLWRRIPPLHFVPDENTGRMRPSSAAFDDHPNGTPMSVVLGNEVLAAGRTEESVLAGHEGFGLVTFSAGLARRLKQGIVRRPELEEPAHAEVFGPKPRPIRRQLASGATWLIPPPSANTV